MRECRQKKAKADHFITLLLCIYRDYGKIQHMKTLLLLLLSVSSFAQEIEPTLAGRGVHEKAGSWVALQCLSNVENPIQSSDCHSFQHLYFDKETNTSENIGPIIPNDQNLKKNLKKMGKDFREYLDPNGYKANMRETLIVTVPLLVFFGPLVLASYSVIATVTAIQISTTVGPLLLAAPIIGSQSKKIVLHTNQLNQPLQDQDGWNWSVKLKKIRHKTFVSYVEFLKTKTPIKR